MIEFQANWMAFWIAPQTARTMFRNVSERFHAVTMAAARRPRTVITMPIGLARRTRFSAFWATVSALVATVDATVAAVLAAFAAASRTYRPTIAVVSAMFRTFAAALAMLAFVFATNAAVEALSAPALAASADSRSDTAVTCALLFLPVYTSSVAWVASSLWLNLAATVGSARGSMSIVGTRTAAVIFAS